MVPQGLGAVFLECVFSRVFCWVQAVLATLATGLELSTNSTWGDGSSACALKGTRLGFLQLLKYPPSISPGSAVAAVKSRAWSTSCEGPAARHATDRGVDAKALSDGTHRTLRPVLKWMTEWLAQKVSCFYCLPSFCTRDSSQRHIFFGGSANISNGTPSERLLHYL